MRLETELLEYVTFGSHPFVLRPISDNISFHSGKKKKKEKEELIILLLISTGGQMTQKQDDSPKN